MTFGSHRLKSVAPIESLLALYNDVGPDYLEVFPIKGKTVGSATVINEARGLSGNWAKPSFNDDGTLLAYPNKANYDSNGLVAPFETNLFQRSGANTWTLLQTLSLNNIESLAVGFSYSGTYLATGGTTGTTVDIWAIPSTFNNWDTPTDWDSFDNDVWGSIDTWSDPTDWDHFVNDVWATADEPYIFQTITHNGSVVGLTDVSWSGDANDTYLAIAYTDSPYFAVWANSGTLGSSYSALATPSDIPAGPVYSLCWDPTYTYLAVGFEKILGSPPLFIYERSGSTLTKLPTPASVPSARVSACRFDPSGRYLAIGLSGYGDSGNWFWLYKRSGTTFTKLADPDVKTVGRCNDLAWTKDGTRLIVATDTNNSFMYRRSGDTLIYEHTFGDSMGCAIYPKSKSQR